MKYSIILKRLFVIAKSKWLLYAFKGHLFSLASFEIISNLKKKSHTFSTIIDVGANSGQFTKVSSYFFPSSKIFVFEPIPTLYEKISKNFKKNKNILVNNLALGNETGIIKFNQNEYGHVSSILEISDSNSHYPNENLTQIDVEISTLDTYFNTDILVSPALLKLDVQGFELEVLKGGLKILNKIDYIIIEANLEQLYTNQPSFTEVNKFLNDNGFELNGMLDFNIGSNNSYIEIDLLYKKI